MEWNDKVGGFEKQYNQNIYAFNGIIHIKINIINVTNSCTLSITWITHPIA